MSTNKFLTLIGGLQTLVTAIADRSGPEDGGKIICTRNDGVVDPSFIVASGNDFFQLGGGGHGGIRSADNGALGQIEARDAGNTALVPINCSELRINGVRASGVNCRAFHSADQAIANNTATTLAFNSERWDSAGLHSNSANNSRLTAPVTGLYSIGACIGFASNSTGSREARILLNGTTLIALHRIPANSSTSLFLTIATDYQLTAGDYVEVVVTQTSGGSLNVLALGNYSPEFWIHLIC